MKKLTPAAAYYNGIANATAILSGIFVVGSAWIHNNAVFLAVGICAIICGVTAGIINAGRL